MIFKPLLPIYVIIFVALAFIAFIVFMLTSKHQRNLPIRRILMIVIMFVIMLRPMVRGGTAVRQESSINVFFALDLTNSMTVADCKNNQRRFEKMRDDVQEIAESFTGARFSIIAMDYDAYVAMPLTDDLDALLNYAPKLSVIDTTKSNGSDLSKLIVYTMEHIESYRELFPERKNVLFVMSDGERTENTKPIITGNQLNALSAARVYGYGTSEGGYVKRVYNGEVSKNSLNHISRIDEENLQDIASRLNGSYENWTDVDFDAQKMKVISSTLELSDSSTIESYRDTYWLLALILAALLLWELSDCLNKVLDERKVVKK